MSKPSKTQIIINSVVAVLYAAAAVAYFVVGKNWYGALWTLFTAVLVWIVATSVKTYQLQRDTYEYRQRLEEQRRLAWQRHQGGRS